MYRDSCSVVSYIYITQGLVAVIKVADRPEDGDDDMERLTKTLATSCIDALGSRRHQSKSGYDQVCRLSDKQTMGPMLGQ